MSSKKVMFLRNLQVVVMVTLTTLDFFFPHYVSTWAHFFKKKTLYKYLLQLPSFSHQIVKICKQKKTITTSSWLANPLPSMDSSKGAPLAFYIV
jgi:hypothetical protein